MQYGFFNKMERTVRWEPVRACSLLSYVNAANMHHFVMAAAKNRGSGEPKMKCSKVDGVGNFKFVTNSVFWKRKTRFLFWELIFFSHE